MMKRLISFICCMLPFGANAAESIVLNSGAGYSVGAGTALDVNIMSIGYDIPTDVGTDNFYAGPNTNTGFTISGASATSTVAVNTILNINSGWNFSIAGNETGPALINVTLNDVTAFGGLDLHNINKLTLNGAMAADSNLNINANTIAAGAISVNGGGTAANPNKIVATTNDTTTDGTGVAFSADSLINKGEYLSVDAKSMAVSGDVQNIGGTMNITLGGKLEVGGDLENSGTSMVIQRKQATDVVDLTVGGTMKNDSLSGTMVITVDNWTINGGNTTNPSIVNSGNLTATIKGLTKFANGFDLSAMDGGNTFSLTTGTLDFGTLTDLLHTNGTFNLTVLSGGMEFGTVSNGDTMTLIAQSVDVGALTNDGTLNVKTTDVGDITIDGALTANTIGATTNIISSGDVTVTGVATNAANMTINGVTINLGGVSNSGAMEIAGLTSTEGSVIISGNVTNTNGNLDIESRQIEISGTLKNESGTTTVKGSDSNGTGVTIGAIANEGGVLNLGALIGTVNVTDGITVDSGSLNIGASTYSITATDSVNIAGDVTLGATTGGATGAGDVYVAASGVRDFSLTSDASMNIAGNVTATDANASRSGEFSAATIMVGKFDNDGNVTQVSNITAQNKGELVFGNANTTNLNVSGNINASNGGSIELYAARTDAESVTGNGTYLVHGQSIVANGADGINIGAGGAGIWFGPGTDANGVVQPMPSVGMVVNGTNTLTLETTADNADIEIDGYVLVGQTDNTDGTKTANNLTLKAAGDVDINDSNVYVQGNLTIDAAGDATLGREIYNSGTFNATADNISAYSLNNSGTTQLTASNGRINFMGGVESSNNLTLTAATVSTGAVNINGGVNNITATSMSAESIDIESGRTDLNVTNVTTSTAAQGAGIKVAGDVTQGGEDGMLNLTRDGTSVKTNALTINGAFTATKYSATYDADTVIAIDGAIDVANAATVNMTAVDSITAGSVSNNGQLMLSANDMTLGAVVNKGGLLSINSGTGVAAVDSFTISGGNVELSGKGMISTGVFDATNKFVVQNAMTSQTNADVNIVGVNYDLTASNFTAAGITQNYGSLLINTSDLDVGDINATNLRIAANPVGNWLDAQITGDVSGNVQFIGLEKMNITGNYTFNDNSIIHAAVLPYGTGAAMNTTTRNYWSTVSLNDDNTLGKITNAADGQAMISVGGSFISDALAIGTPSNGVALKDGQIGIDLFSIVDQGTAIWLLHADGGLNELDLATKIRNLNVNFCNADGSLCFNYLDSFNTYNGSDENLPVYLSVRDTNENGAPDSLYIVFDPRFGGPVEVFKIQPIVDREVPHTNGEYVSAGALDNLIAGQLNKSGFYNKTPIEVIPFMFRGTNLETMAKQLYDRMEYYNLERDGTGLARFSRLFQARELEQLAGSVVLNEHTSFRSFEDRMLDEFIWNRNRNLKKAWADIDYGMFSQNASDGKRVDGNRFSISGGFDWQESQTLILGLTGRISHMSGTNDDFMDLGYRPGEFIAGNVNVDVADTTIGVGGYLMKTLGDKTRLYGNAFLDMHWLDVSRDQTYINGTIDGFGTAFSLISEWGLLHDWLNQYVVGNAYARVGYNTGFSVTEKVHSHNYMKLQSDGYMILTPGYSLTAQKRIYPSAWLQIRPYATAGLEYDVLGAPDKVKYKFAPAQRFTNYKVDINPLWANIGGGVEILSATGIQVGLDYRYQYNTDIQLHNIKISGSYRF